MSLVAVGAGLIAFPIEVSVNAVLAGSDVGHRRPQNPRLHADRTLYRLGSFKLHCHLHLVLRLWPRAAGEPPSVLQRVPS